MTQETPRFQASIIIPTYNRSDLLARTLETIAAQDLGRDAFEVIVADDGSSDDTAEVAKGFLDRLNLQYHFQEDQGFRAGTARNMGIRQARSQICVFVDTGILLGRGAVREHVRIHAESARPSALVGYVYGFDDHDRSKDSLLSLVDLRDPDSSMALLREHGICDGREPLYRELGDDLAAWPAPWVVFWTCHVSARRDTLVEAGLFDESYVTWGGEDTDLALSLERNGVRFVLSRAAAGIHYPHDKHAPWATGDAAGIADYERKMANMHRKYRTRATELWQTTTYDKLNQRLLAEARGAAR